MSSMRIRWESIAFASCLLVAIVFDVASVSTMYTEYQWVQYVTFIVFTLLSFGCTSWLGWLVATRSARRSRHVDFAESSTTLELWTTVIAFFAFAVSDLFNLFERIVSPAVFIAVRVVLSSFALVVSILGVIGAFMTQENQTLRLALFLDTSRTSAMKLTRRVVRLSQYRTVALYVTIFWWFVADIVYLLHLDGATDPAEAVAISSIVVVLFALSSIATIALDLVHVELRREFVILDL